MRISGTGNLWGRSSCLERTRCAPVVPMLRRCWGDAGLRWDILHYGILEIPVGKALWNPRWFSPVISPVLLIFTRNIGASHSVWCASGLGKEASFKQVLLQGDRSSPKPFCHLLFKATLGLNLAFTTRPLLWTPSTEPFRGGNTYPWPGVPKCPLVQCFAALFLSYFEMFSSRKKRQRCLWTGPE